jgi:hypothetical protein
LWPLRPPITFREPAKWWLNHAKERSERKPMAASTLETWGACIENWLDPNIGDTPLPRCRKEVWLQIHRCCGRARFDAPESSRIDQNFTVAPNQIVRVPGSGPKKPPGVSVLEIVPKLLGLFVSPVRHNPPLPATGPGAAPLPGYETFGFAKCGVLVNPMASALTSIETRSVSLKLRSTLRFMLKYPGPRNWSRPEEP